MADLSAQLYGGATIAPSPTLPANANVDYYNALPDHVKPMVNAVIEGRIPASGRNSVDKKVMTQLIDVAANIDPTFDASVFQNRMNVRKEFGNTKSGAGANMLALNTAIHHLGNLYDHYQGLGNGDTGWTNALGNKLAQENYYGLGNLVPSLKQHDQNIQYYGNKVGADAQAVSEELAKVFRSTGMSEADIKAWQTKINTNMTPSEMKGVVGEAVNLLAGRFDPLVQRYNQTLGTDKDYSFFMTPSALKEWNRLQKGTSSPDAPYVPMEGTTKATVDNTPKLSVVQTGTMQTPKGSIKVFKYSNGMVVASDGKVIQNGN